jgi:hypothetical protein
MRRFISEIEKDIENFFDLGLRNYGSNYELKYSGSTKELN